MGVLIHAKIAMLYERTATGLSRQTASTVPTPGSSTPLMTVVKHARKSTLDLSSNLLAILASRHEARDSTSALWNATMEILTIATVEMKTARSKLTGPAQEETAPTQTPALVSLVQSESSPTSAAQPTWPQSLALRQ
jgi:hypothetical protein